MSSIPLDYRLDSYSFNLPEELIAQAPAPERGSSRLMVVDRNTGSLEISTFKDILKHLPEKCLIVANNSRVIPARIHGMRNTGGKVEFLLLTPLPLLLKNIPQAHPSPPSPEYHEADAEGLLRSSKQVKIGENVLFSPEFSLELLERQEFGRCKVRLKWRGNLEEHFAGLGSLPLPPYIKRPANDDDSLRYQTIYSRQDKNGSVAAPTAGLHFTPELRKEVEESGREWAEATLYVGYGTFSPVRSQDIRKHEMHAEYVELSPGTAEAVNRAKKEKRPVVAVGTTSARILEGVWREQHGEKASEPALSISPYSGWINIFLYPGESFHVVDSLITNFHLPESSLFMLVSALAGRQAMLAAYAKAVEKNFHFFSYGDAMLIL